MTLYILCKIVLWLFRENEKRTASGKDSTKVQTLGAISESIMRHLDTSHDTAPQLAIVFATGHRPTRCIYTCQQSQFLADWLVNRTAHPLLPGALGS